MDWLIDAFTNPILVVPIISWLSAQILKALINFLVNKKFSIHRLVGDGGMPSGHSATVVALACMCGFFADGGFGGTAFAISAILAVIVMHDASGVRRETGKQAESIISIVSALNEFFIEKDKEIKTQKLKVLVGHTPLQVIAGAILGFIVSMSAYLIIMYI